MRHRSKIVVILILGVLAVQTVRAESDEEKAVKALTDVWLHAKIERDEKSPHKPVVSVVLRWNKFVRDENLVHLAALKELRNLNLENTPIGDDGLRHLADLRKLEELNLSD